MGFLTEGEKTELIRFLWANFIARKFNEILGNFGDYKNVKEYYSHGGYKF